MFCIKNNEKNKSAVILSPEAGVKISGASVESVINDRAKTKRYSAKRDLYGDFAYAQPLKMTEKALSFLRLRGASGAQGISTPASCREAHIRRFIFNLIRRSLEKFFKKNFRDDSSFYFGFAKVTALALFFSLINISESRAECDAKTYTWMKLDCYTAWNPGAPDNCGAGCTYNYNNGKLTVTATKPGAVILEGMFAPSYYDEKADFPNITNIEIAGEFETIGQHAFLGNGATLSGKNGILYVNNLNHNPFDSNTLIGTIIVNDKQTTLGKGPWYFATLNATVILPPTITSIKWAALNFSRLGENAKIYCGAENCEEMFRNVNCDEAVDSYYKERCKNNLETLLSSGKLLAYPDGCTKMGASGCTKCKNENFKLNDGECDRLRYTPAEAAEVLTDDNNNSVTITFKK